MEDVKVKRKPENRKEIIREMAIKEASYIVVTNSTIRTAAKELNTSKSTLHKDVTQRLWKFDEELAKAVRKVIIKNKNERHIRGGKATKLKYLKSKKENL